MIEALEFLGRGPKAIFKDGRLVSPVYYRGHHPEVGTPWQGYQGDETRVEVPIPTNAPLKVKEVEGKRYISRCVEHDLHLPPVEDYEYADGYCENCVKDLSQPKDEVTYKSVKERISNDMLEVVRSLKG